MNTLDTREKRILLRASREIIGSYFDTLPKHIRSRCWLYKHNRYRTTCTKIFERDVKRTTINQKHIFSYVGASAITHIIDGWSYLGRAIDAVLRGDTYRTVHLAYYAELRAAMGLLGAEGIGVFDHRHAIIDKTGLCHVFPPVIPKKRSSKGTHVTVWLALNHWASLKKAADLIDGIVAPGSIPLSGWMDALGIKKPLQPLARQWLKTWGIDLSVLEFDKNLRNLASYRPSEFRRPNALPITQILEFLENLWLLFEPQSGKFVTMENYLLKRALKQLGGRSYNSLNLISSLGMNVEAASDWVNFLNKPDDPLPFVLADSQSSIDEPECHLQIIARAALLLFIASSVGRALLAKAAYNKDELMFWWEREGVEKGIWRNGNNPAELEELWANIRDIISESEKWRNTNQAGNVSLWDLRTSQPEALDYLTVFEIVGMWAIIP